MNQSMSDEEQTPLDYLKQYGEAATTFFGAIGGGIRLIHTIASHTSIAWKCGVAVAYFSAILYLGYVFFAKNQYKNVIPVGDLQPRPQFDKWLRWGAVATLFVITILPVGYISYSIFPDNNASTFRILVADLEAPDQDISLTHSILTGLRNRVSRYDSIEVVPLDSTITIHEGGDVARDIGTSNNADMVIWGWYDIYETADTASSVIKYEVLKSPIPINISEEEEVYHSLSDIKRFKTEVVEHVDYVVSLTLGIAHFGRRNFDASINFYTDALNHSYGIRDSTGSSRAHYLRAYSYLGKGLYDNALNDFRHVKGGDSFVSKALYNWGTVLLSQDKDSLAVNRFNKSLEIDSSYARAWANRGLALANLGDTDKAINSFDKALALDSTSAHVWVNQALVFAKQDRFSQAMKNYNEALKIDSTDSFIWTNRGVMLSEWGKYHEAIESHKRALELDPKNPWILFNMGAAYMREYQDLGNDINLQKALRSFERSLKYDSSDADTWSNKAAVLGQLGRTKPATKSFNKAISIDKSMIHKMINLGKSLIRSGRLKESTKYMREAVKFRPNKLEAWQTLGRSLVRRDSFKQAIDAYNRALNIDSTHAVTLLLKGNALNMDAQSRKALKLYTRAVEEDPSLADAWFNRAFILRSFGDESEAKTSLNRACELKEDYCSKPYPSGVSEVPF